MPSPSRRHQSPSSRALSQSPQLPQQTVAEPESMRKLRALREKITKELTVETKARSDMQAQEPIVPLSLAADPPGSPARKSAKRGAPKAIPAAAKEKLAAVAKDKWVQRELEAELERKAQETAQLTAHNTRLRDMVTLRQECNQRREESVQGEIERLQGLADAVCVDDHDMAGAMERLRGMHRQIQDGAAHLKAAIEEKAEAERLGLVRHYRVKLREVKQQLHDQQQSNLEGARVWIDRHRVLERDRDEAVEVLRRLEAKNEKLRQQNDELTVLQGHQQEQRQALTTRIAVVKRENRRLGEHVATLDGELKAKAPSRAASAATDQMNATAPARVGTAMGASRARSSLATPAKRGAKDGVESAHSAVLKQMRRTLAEMRGSLKQVRAAHIELLQERTELEMFLRQCLEDVRRDLYRCTVVSNLGRNMRDAAQPLVTDYTAADRRKLVELLHSKLRVFAHLHGATFPTRGDWDDDDAALRDPAVEDMAAGRLAQLGDAVVADAAAETEVDHLWGMWKRWTARAA